MALRQLLIETGIDPARDNVEIAPIPGAHGAGMSFGVMAAQALEEHRVDGFWANGMGAELAVRRGVGTVVLDARRDPGAPGLHHGLRRRFRSPDRGAAARSPQPRCAPSSARSKRSAKMSGLQPRSAASCFRQPKPS